ncbi:gluconate 2-dehydrogenase subunit 3 family protein [Pontibacter diazotrophicus]|uniref:Gluconate 2-dehydrogenase subunit 3 family protein n=1 Tax=Pontibacter diazotrophicus TaxID=1400979 RepID=A0A3D8L015_9BACT|nr:gluconate 2-dehydrogenase subunit 3 family protein [Pontibacter diazotrophicus]RDV10778.1 gluconate 2-dehydrogenase subunit 3 family protein [Pontibacter diazotrophicus]
MDRRESLKAIVLSTVSSALLLEGCDSSTTEQEVAQVLETPESSPADGRMPEEIARLEEVTSRKFFTDEEVATITVLSDIIIPADEVSGSASEAGVPDFIEFIVKDKPEFQTPMRSGLKWLDIQSLNQYEKPFRDLNEGQRLEIVDAIAYPERAAPEMKKGVAFFSLMRNLTATGFFTSEMGVEDIGYLGNRPNQWKGVPEEVLRQHNLAYTEKELRECVTFDRNV